MEYCVDTSVYIQAHRTYYAFDLAPGFWTALAQYAESKTLVSPLSVHTELINGNDELAAWAKKNKSILFIEPNEKVIQAFRQIAEYSTSHYQEHWVSEFLRGADPWVIAQAMADNLIVVTMEENKLSEDIDPKSKRFKGRLKIPNICTHFGVKWISTYTLVRTLKIGLG